MQVQLYNPTSSAATKQTQWNIVKRHNNPDEHHIFQHDPNDIQICHTDICKSGLLTLQDTVMRVCRLVHGALVVTRMVNMAGQGRSVTTLVRMVLDTVEQYCVTPYTGLKPRKVDTQDASRIQVTEIYPYLLITAIRIPSQPASNPAL